MQVLTVVAILTVCWVAILVMDRGLANLLEQAGLTLVEWAQHRRARAAKVQDLVAKRAERVYTMSDEDFARMMRVADGEPRK
jgi:hypothetical protein